MSNDLQHKLQQFAAEPPARVWEAIDLALDAKDDVLGERLQQFEAHPPAGAWAGIEAGLNKKSTAPQRSVIRRFRKPFRYIATAAAILALAFAVNLLFDSGMEPGDSQTALSPATSAGKPVPHPVLPSAGGPAAGKRAADSAKPERSRSSNGTGISALAASRYISRPDEDGNIVRMSKKIAPVVNCAEQTAAEKWSRCKENMEALQAKLASAVASPSTDFAGLMDMLKSLEENR